jgi:hypothetical protein
VIGFQFLKIGFSMLAFSFPLAVCKGQWVLIALEKYAQQMAFILVRWWEMDTLAVENVRLGI